MAIPAFQKLSKFAQNLPISNEATERMVKRTFEFINYGARSEANFQATLHVVGAAIEKVPNHRTKAAIMKAHSQSE